MERKGHRIPGRRAAWWRHLKIAAALILCTAAAEAAQDHEAIREAALGFLKSEAARAHEGRTEVRIGRLDSRLKLAECGQPLKATLAPGARLMGSTSIRVRCPGPTPWSIYVTGHVAVFGKVLTAARPLPRGTMLEPAMLKPVEYDLSKARFGYFRRPEEVDGMLLARSVKAGAIITPGVLKARRLIRRGQQVTLVARRGGLAVKMKGKAMADGARGEVIRVQAVNSRRIVEGEVLAPGVVKVTL